MIKSFKHKGLQLFYETENIKGIQASHVKKLKVRLMALDTAMELEDISLPGFDLHPLHGNRNGIWSIKVNGNWRITFSFEENDVYIVNYEDYH